MTVELADSVQEPAAKKLKTTSEPDSLLSLERNTIPQDWLDELEAEFKKPYFRSIKSFLQKEIKAGKTIFPPENEIYSFTKCPLNDVKVVILGQDPYHGQGQAHGLCFSVKKGVQIPPSLRNIYKELARSIPGFTIPKHGYLDSWSEQGVLLLNATLTVEKAKANSHSKCGWEYFTDRIIRSVNAKNEHVVFLLWGAFAQKKAEMIDKTRHLVLESAHPSPLSARRGFHENNHFKDANEYLKKHSRQPINWNSINKD